MYEYFNQSYDEASYKAHLPHTVIGLSMHFIIWFVSSVPIGGSALAIIGLLYGPVFPACLTLANELLPEEFKMVSMAIM